MRRNLYLPNGALKVVSSEENTVAFAMSEATSSTDLMGFRGLLRTLLRALGSIQMEQYRLSSSLPPFVRAIPSVRTQV